MKREVKIIQNKEYNYVLCPRCKVWIQEKDYKNNTHINCDIYYNNLLIRERAEKKALGGWTDEDELIKHYGGKNETRN